MVTDKTILFKMYRFIDSHTIKDPITQCWNWTGSLTSSGYAVVTGSRRIYGSNRRGPDLRVHRINYKRFKSEVPSGILLMHSCDNRRCVNPSHLEKGGDKENIQDAARKGRMYKKIDDIILLSIVDRIKNGESAYKIAADFNLHNTMIYNIKNGKQHKIRLQELGVSI